MTDMEMIKLCADAIGLRVQLLSPETGFPGYNHYSIPNPSDAPNERWDPLMYDDQVMALVKRMGLDIRHLPGQMQWSVIGMGLPGPNEASAVDLNRAICECVAKTQNSK